MNFICDYKIITAWSKIKNYHNLKIKVIILISKKIDIVVSTFTDNTSYLRLFNI